MDRREFLRLTAGVAGMGLAGTSLGAAMQDVARRPNILFIFSDDHAPHAISAYGSKINHTPQIDRLAREGAIFRNSFCANSICAPSRATEELVNRYGDPAYRDRIRELKTRLVELREHYRDDTGEPVPLEEA